MYGLPRMRVNSRHGMLATAALVLSLSAAPALSHNPFTSGGEAALAGWLSVVLLLCLWVVHGVGSWRHPPGRLAGFGFHATTLLCALALFGPLDGWAKTSTAAHMGQHMLLMVVIAPLWILCRPLPQLVAGSGRWGAWLWKPMLRLAARPLYAAYLHAIAIWFWHTPYFYMAAVDNPWWHAVEHVCFLVTAGVFWWAVLRSSARNIPWALLAVLFTLMHTGFLGAILTFAGSPVYGEARDLQDQQLAGLIMWVPGAIPYILAAAWIAHRWIRRLQRRMDAAERRY